MLYSILFLVYSETIRDYAIYGLVGADVHIILHGHIWLPMTCIFRTKTLSKASKKSERTAQYETYGHSERIRFEDSCSQLPAMTGDESGTVMCQTSSPTLKLYRQLPIFKDSEE